MDKDGEIPKGFEALASKAKDAVERLLKEGKKIANQIEDKALIKNGFTTLTGHLNDLNHWSMFQELPNKSMPSKTTLESFVGKIAVDVDRFNGEINVGLKLVGTEALHLARLLSDHAHASSSWGNFDGGLFYFGLAHIPKRTLNTLWFEAVLHIFAGSEFKLFSMCPLQVIV